jgi:hypothetical protein
MSISEIFELDRDRHHTRNFIEEQLPIHGANRSKPHRIRQGGQDEQAYAQLMLKIDRKKNREQDRAVLMADRLNLKAVGMVKAATLVMLQPSAPAREQITRMHVPSQPLMRSPLSRSQTPAPPRRVSRFFRVWLPVQVALMSRSLSLCRNGKFDFANPFSRRRRSN